MQIHEEINKFINLPENKKHPITYLIQKYDSVTQSQVKESICAIVNSNKEKSARIESSGISEPMDKISPVLWQQELHYFIVEKILSIGICRMDVIFKAINDGVLHVPQSYTKWNHKKNFIKTHILSLLADSLDRKFIDFVVPARNPSAGTDAASINYNHGALVYTGLSSTLLSGMPLISRPIIVKCYFVYLCI